MFNEEIVASQVKDDKFTFPSEGNITLAVRTSDYTLAQVMLHLSMEAGSVIPAHIHEGVAEVLYVTDGVFINEGKEHPAGTSLHVKAGQQHGPHSTVTGCKLLVLWSEPSTAD